MGENSGGNKMSERGIKKFGEQFARVNRSASLGSEEYSTAEINKINFDPNKKRFTDQIRTYSGKNNKDKDITLTNTDENPNIPGAVNNYEQFFKPRNSVSRTPPEQRKTGTTEKKAENIEDKTSGKRLGEKISPGTENQSKKPCDRLNFEDSVYQGNTREASQIYPKSPTQVNKHTNHICMETLLVGIFGSLNKMQTVTNKEDQEMVRAAANDIHKNLTLITYKIGQLEQEKMALEHNLQLHEIHRKIPLDTKTPTSNKQKPALNKRTYATAVQKTASQEVNTPDEQLEETWKTPKTSKKLETVIRIDNITDPKQTIQQLKKEISSNNVDGGFKNIRHLTSGAIVIESCNETQQKKLKAALENKNNIKVKESQNINPMFMITGILRGYQEADFIHELVRLNSEIEAEFPSINICEELKVITKKQCRNPAKENWILEAQPAIAKWFLKKQTIYFDLMKVYVQEHLNLALCFNCAGFGHVAKYCRETLCCHKCGANDHWGKDCTATHLKCPNCIKMKYKAEESQHSARDVKCPVYQKKLTNYKNQINYS